MDKILLFALTLADVANFFKKKLLHCKNASTCSSLATDVLQNIFRQSFFQLFKNSSWQMLNRSPIFQESRLKEL